MLFKANLVESFILIFNDMNNIQIFENPEFGQVRVVMTESNEPLFCLADVCKVLEISNPSQVKSRLDSDGLQMLDLQVLNNPDGVIINELGNTQATFIDESNLYQVIFQSRKESAVIFRRWVTKEVIPSIRKTGSYSVNLPKTYKEALIELLAKVEENEKLQIENKGLQIENTELKPKGEFYDAVAGSDTLIDMNQVSKTLNIKGLGRNKLFEFLRSQKILMNDNQPYQQYVDKGYFKLIEVRWTNPKTGDTNITLKTMVFQTGLDFIRKTVKKYYK